MDEFRLVTSANTVKQSEDEKHKQRKNIHVYQTTTMEGNTRI